MSDDPLNSGVQLLSGAPTKPVPVSGVKTPQGAGCRLRSGGCFMGADVPHKQKYNPFPTHPFPPQPALDPASCSHGPCCLGSTELDAVGGVRGVRRTSVLDERGSGAGRGAGVLGEGRKTEGHVLLQEEGTWSVPGGRHAQSPLQEGLEVDRIR
ncbi:hypothetical protein NDU88_010205 [Pleurodeles waltl]|uniref:Uncharacterized protein n=1 Tax=Pleurodeles waltl TaxID=8319 RepID=A0AAV7PXD2_PLEWA|nr:hypothetical protein NDU88_010205 [Pleurodeles waltl]